MADVDRQAGALVEGKRLRTQPAAESTQPPTTWIFQGNPDRFDLDTYLAASQRITWTIRQAPVPPRVGDVVYLWRSAGRSKAIAGIVARTIVDSGVWSGPDDPAARPFWRDDTAEVAADRVWLRVERVAQVREVLKRDWLKDDPVCRDLLVVRQPHGTNYVIPPVLAQRLDHLWRRTGIDWTRVDCIAALWAYDVTYGHEVSKKPESPVADVALRIGRVVTGVYNKVMNFRSIDPRDDRAGLPGGSETDRKVWDEFYDPERRVLRSAALEASFAELWGDSRHPAASTPGQGTSPPGAPPPPGAHGERSEQTIRRIIRDTRVTRWVKQVHRDTCQVCGIQLVGSISPFSEGAHIRPLGAEHQGPDDVSNVLCLCPNHHALLDHLAYYLEDDLRIVAMNGVVLPDRLRTAPEHVIGLDHVRYHRTLVLGTGRL